MSAYSDEKKRARQLKVALSEEERAEIKTRADALGVSMAELMRKSALGQKIAAPLTEERAQMWRELGFFFRDISLASRDVREHIEEREGGEDVPGDVAKLRALLERVDARMEDFVPTLTQLREALSQA